MLKPFFEFFTLWVVLPAARSVGTIEKRMSDERCLVKKNDRSPALCFSLSYPARPTVRPSKYKVMKMIPTFLPGIGQCFDTVIVALSSG